MQLDPVSGPPASGPAGAAELGREIRGDGVAGRYALALFQEADAAGRRAEVGRDLERLGQAIAATPELAAALERPRLGRQALSSALQEVARHLKLDDRVRRFVGLVAIKGRASRLKAMIDVYARLEAAAGGRISADVVSARPLSAEQLFQLESRLAARVGAAVDVRTRVDPSILGGLVVRLGSQQIDSSVATRLARMGQAMKG